MTETITGEANTHITDQEALDFHSQGKPGKIAIVATKPLMTQRDLSLAYSPGVAVPCLAIEKDPDKAYDYTAKGNLVAVISNGTAVLGLGRLGAMASKPVMEGKAVLFKRFADIDAVDLEIDATDPDTVINAIRHFGPSWGGINLEDIASPECFIIEQKLKEVMDIPVFHDDQHGTAIITLAGLINAAHVTGREFRKMKVVLNGAGAAGIACIELIKSYGLPDENVIALDRTGVIYEGRTEEMNQWKSAHAVKTDARTLVDAINGADVFIGLSAKGALLPAMVELMAPNPIIFAMANPDPEISPELARQIRPDAIIATGRSDYPNQVNNVMGFPYIFRGALDVRASTINDEMKLAAVQAIAALAREPVPDEVSAAYAGRKMQFGADYIIPSPFDPRLISTVPPAVAQAAMTSGVARKPITDMAHYRRALTARLNPTANSMNLVFESVASKPKSVVFAEGEAETIIRTALLWSRNGYGCPILVGREKQIRETMRRIRIPDADANRIRISNAANTGKTAVYLDFLYQRLARKGFLQRDCARMVKNDRNIFAACMVACGDADALITGLTRPYASVLTDIRKVIGPKPNAIVFGLSMLISGGRRVFISDTSVNQVPTPQELADIAVHTAEKVRRMGHVPRVALLSFANFGNPMYDKAQRIRDAVALLNERKVAFEFDGEMAPDVALNPDLLKLYPFCRLTGPANVLIMPALHSASIASKLLQELGGGTVIGPILCGLEQSVQIAQMGASVADTLNLAAFAAIYATGENGKTEVDEARSARARIERAYE